MAWPDCGGKPGTFIRQVEFDHYAGSSWFDSQNQALMEEHGITNVVLAEEHLTERDR